VVTAVELVDLVVVPVAVVDLHHEKVAQGMEIHSQEILQIVSHQVVGDMMVEPILHLIQIVVLAVVVLQVLVKEHHQLLDLDMVLMVD
tara:strand:- start:27 stop:290 length:264 start_codon:yes stop_codon:yes gene_type:complete